MGSLKELSPAFGYSTSQQAVSSSSCFSLFVNQEPVCDCTLHHRITSAATHQKKLA